MSGFYKPTEAMARLHDEIAERSMRPSIQWTGWDAEIYTWLTTRLMCYRTKREVKLAPVLMRYRASLNL